MHFLVRQMALVSLSGLLFISCTVHPREPVGTGTFSYVSGRLAWTYPVDIQTAWSATLRALDKLDVQVQDKAVDGLGGSIIAQRADQTKVFVTFEPVSKRATRVNIKIGAFGNREQSENIHSLVQQELKL